MQEGGDLCPMCKVGHMCERQEELAFKQFTDKGYVFCRVTMPMKICERCGHKDWSEGAEAILNEAVRNARDRLP